MMAIAYDRGLYCRQNAGGDWRRDGRRRRQTANPEGEGRTSSDFQETTTGSYTIG